VEPSIPLDTPPPAATDSIGGASKGKVEDR
jgi:hypothetical protein